MALEVLALPLQQPHQLLLDHTDEQRGGEDGLNRHLLCHPWRNSQAYLEMSTLRP